MGFLGQFLGQFLELWKAPAVDLSATMTGPNYIKMTKSEINAINTSVAIETQAKLTIILNEAARIKAAQDADITNVEIHGVDVIGFDGEIVKVEFTNGIPSVRKLDTKTKKLRQDSLVFDDSDNQDYNNRYISIDAPNVSNDVADVAFFRIVKANDLKTVVFPVEDNGYRTPGISKNKFRQFILISLAEASQERMQIVETSEDFQLLFYGKRPEVLQIQGILKNTKDNPWNMNMVFLWDNFMRGTKLAEQGNILQLYADRNLYSGYPFAFQRSKVAPSDFTVNFSFSFIVVERLSSEDLTIDLNSISLDKSR